MCPTRAETCRRSDRFRTGRDRGEAFVSQQLHTCPYARPSIRLRNIDESTRHAFYRFFFVFSNLYNGKSSVFTFRFFCFSYAKTLSDISVPTDGTRGVTCISKKQFVTDKPDRLSFTRNPCNVFRFMTDLNFQSL